MLHIESTFCEQLVVVCMVNMSSRSCIYDNHRLFMSYKVLNYKASRALKLFFIRLLAMLTINKYVCHLDFVLFISVTY